MIFSKFLKCFIPVLLLLFIISCASIDINESLYIPQKNPDLPKRQERIVFGYTLKIPNEPLDNENTLVEALYQVIQRNFIYSINSGRFKDKQSFINSVRQIIQDVQIDHLLFISEIELLKEKNIIRKVWQDSFVEWTYRLKYVCESLSGKEIENRLISASSRQTGFAPINFSSNQKIVAFNSVKEAALEFESEIQRGRILVEEEKRKKELLAEEERRNKELLARLNAIQDKFKPYRFDVLEFVNYAKANLKTRGEIDFGGAVPEIDFRTFKEKNYVETKINYLVTYNTLRVSMYESASMTFDEIVKKLAKKIVTSFKNQDSIAGFIFKVTYTNKDFLDKSDMPRLVTNEFILPKETCLKYANLDITNQDLINQSIVLVDEERISLNLQISK